jgi:hypothetical protein
MTKRFMSVSLRRRILGLGAACAVAVVMNVARVSATAYFLDVTAVTCWFSNDPVGADEPYLKLDGSRIWTGPDCSPITTMYPGVHTTFWEHADLEVMEDDFGPDDQLVYVNVTGAVSGQGTQSAYSYVWIDYMGWVPYYSVDYSVYQ